MGNNISIKDIAKMANVSIATVSRVINNNGRFSSETEERVKRIIKESGYVTNLAAKELRKQKTQNIGVLVPDITNEYFMKLFAVIENELFQEGYQAFLCNTNENEEIEKKRVQMMAMQNVCAVIYVSSGLADVGSLLEKLPAIFIDRIPERLPEYYCALESDNIQGGRLAAEELVQAGCEKFLILTSARRISGHRARCQGFQEELEKRGIQKENIHIETVKTIGYEDAYRKIYGLVKEEGKIQYDGIFATSDLLAIGCQRALSNLGIPIPEDVKIVGYDDISVTAFNQVTITTIHQQIDVLGKKAVEYLMQILKGETVEERVTRIPVWLVQRASTGYPEKFN